MRYNPEEKIDGGGKAAPGMYRFRVDKAEETMFRSGNEGLAVELAVAAFPDRDITVFSRFVYLPKSLWKLEEFFNSIGVDFARSQETQPEDLIGLTGEAVFALGEKGYLEVDTYCAASANNGPDTRKPAPRPAPKTTPKPAPSRYREPGEDDAPPPHSDADCPL